MKHPQNLQIFSCHCLMFNDRNTDKTKRGIKFTPLRFFPLVGVDTLPISSRICTSVIYLHHIPLTQEILLHYMCMLPHRRTNQLCYFYCQTHTCPQ